jgi:peptidyl-Lys metalloendopeptidase
MASALRFYMLLSSALIMVSCEASTMQLTLNVDSKQLETGRVVLNAELLNRGDQVVRVLRWNTPLEASLVGDLYRITTDEFVLPYQGRMVKRGAPKNEDYVVLNAGESVTNAQDLSLSYSFCAHRTYHLEFTGVITGAETSVVPVQVNDLHFTTNENFPNC